jgi:hypothetical protein
MIIRSNHFEFDREKSREIADLADDETLNTEQRDLIRTAGEVQPFITEPASHCFYCGEKLTIPAIMWNGRSRDGKDALEIWLHPKCAENLAAGLLRDAEELGFGEHSG